MTKQHEITEKKPLLKEDGTLTEEGWAKSLLLRYDRSKIRASWLRIKEWDYYYVINHDGQYGLTCTVADLGYIGLMAVAWLDFKRKKFMQSDTLTFFPRGKIGLLPDSGNGVVSYKDKKIFIKYEYNLPKRRIIIEAPKFKTNEGKKGLKANIVLHQPPEMDSIVIATSWKENRKAFYYNQKTNCMPAKGEVKIGGDVYSFQPENSMGGLDWGRGRWTYKNRWYWSSVSGYINSVPFGWNLGYGFSDRTPASENAVFYNNKIHKLDEVVFHFDKNNYMKPWKFTSNDGRLEMKFMPLLDRSSKFNLLFLKSIQHQVFGYFTGKVILDEGTELQIENMLGFAEDVLNCW